MTPGDTSSRGIVIPDDRRQAGTSTHEAMTLRRMARCVPCAAFLASLAAWILAAVYIFAIRMAIVDVLAMLLLGVASSWAVWRIVRAGLRARAGGAADLAGARDEMARHAEELEARVQARTRELEAANSELESFAYSVSHDLRAPVRHIDGFSRMLEEDHGERLDPDGRRLLATVRKGAERMGRLIDDLLAFSRFGRAAMAPAQLDMTAIARGIADELARDAASCAIAVEPLPPARGDAALVRQIWINLIGNAVKYSAKRPDPRVEVTGRSEGELSVYCVKDNGAGFDPRYADKLFKVFQRLHTEEEFGGTGVGLAIVHRIVARHGGRTWAEGRPGEGASFWFSLPAGVDSARKG
jgi:light-regulated signal transduction histidine kinase (bacteriophytochrome)